MARFVGHERCPNCGSRDNLARYDDGGAFCFGCHYKERATHAPMRRMGDTTDHVEGLVYPIPDDICTHFRGDAVSWLASFHLDLPTAIRYGLVWSPSREQLIYQMGNVWQARNFNPDRKAKRKNFTSGDVNECLHIYGVPVRFDSIASETLVIVEDPLSAIRIADSGVADAMPLLGSHLGQARLNAVTKIYNSLVFWLDPDKLKEARAMEQRAKYMGRSTRTVYTDEDPKCYTSDQIKEILGAGTS